MTSQALNAAQNKTRQFHIGFQNMSAAITTTVIQKIFSHTAFGFINQTANNTGRRHGINLNFSNTLKAKSIYLKFKVKDVSAHQKERTLRKL